MPLIPIEMIGTKYLIEYARQGGQFTTRHEALRELAHRATKGDQEAKDFLDLPQKQVDSDEHYDVI